MSDNFKIIGIFPSPVYTTKRDFDLDSIEEKEIEDIIKEGMADNENNSRSNNTYIFNSTKLKELKEFCEEHIRIYVNEIINPAAKRLDFYITQSWINVNKPGEYHHNHSHSNSIISGVFYVSNEEDDAINFYDPAESLKGRIDFKVEEFNLWNSPSWFFPVKKNDLLLFPSWLRHSVDPNKRATKDRISISFNVFARGTLGIDQALSELILK